MSETSHSPDGEREVAVPREAATPPQLLLDSVERMVARQPAACLAAAFAFGAALAWWIKRP